MCMIVVKNGELFQVASPLSVLEVSACFFAGDVLLLWEPGHPLNMSTLRGGGVEEGKAAIVGLKLQHALQPPRRHLTTRRGNRNFFTPLTCNPGTQSVFIYDQACSLRQPFPLLHYDRDYDPKSNRMSRFNGDGKVNWRSNRIRTRNATDTSPTTLSLDIGGHT